jgi:hypothetical protein
MAQTASLLVDPVIALVPVRQSALSLFIPPRFSPAARLRFPARAMHVVQRALIGNLLERAGLRPDQADSNVVELIQRFGSAANPAIHLP